MKKALILGLAFIMVLLFFKVVWARLKDMGLGGQNVQVSLQWITTIPAGGVGPGNYGRKLQVGGLKRFYEIHVPPSYNKRAPVPVVLLFHGGGGYPGAIRFESGMERVSDQEGFIVVYPAGQPGNRLFSDRLLIWNDGRSTKGTGLSDDVAFVRALLDDLPRLFNVDPRRIYAAGFSNGAQFSYVLASRMSDRIAAIAAVAGQRPVGEFTSPPPRPISVIQFAGKQDNLAPYAGGSPPEGFGTAKFITQFKPVREAIQSWVSLDGCPSQPAEVRRVGRAVKERWGPCKNDTEVILWTLEDGGHAWPGGNMLPAGAKIGQGNINRDIAASELIWEFFKRHPLR